VSIRSGLAALTLCVLAIGCSADSRSTRASPDLADSHSVTTSTIRSGWSLADPPTGTLGQAEPAQAAAGSTVVVTPASEINPSCSLIGSLWDADDQAMLVGQLKRSGEFQR
jgi:hypothetical protein